MTEPLFSNADVAALRTVFTDAVVKLFDVAAKATLLTRRQKALLLLMEQGYVAELVRPLPNRVSRRYIMRHPLAHETDGAYVTANTIERLTELGLVVKVVMPWNGKTWVFSRSRYESSQMGKAHSQSPVTSTAENSTP